MIRIFLAFLLVMASMGCQQAPTKARNTADAPTADEILQANPAILDVRTALDFGVSNVPKSIHVFWEDLTEPAPRKGLLSEDTTIARRLALWGVEPSRPVLIIGYGVKGRGEAGWLAWYLHTLGVRNITLGGVQEFRPQIPRGEYVPTNAPFWTPRVDAASRAEISEVKRNLRRAKGKKLFFVDVRPATERVARPMTMYLTPTQMKSVKLIDLEWINFWDEDGHPSNKGVYILRKAGVQPEDVLYLLSEDGLASGSAAYALLKLGFGKPRNVIGGLSRWKSR